MIRNTIFRLSTQDGRATFYDKFYGRIWKQFREAARKDNNLGAYYLKALAAFLKTKPVRMTEDDINKILADLLEELEKTETPQVMTSLVRT